MDIKTGQVLACVSTPSFDTNKFAFGITQPEFNDLLKNEVFKGNLPAEQFAEIMDFQAKYGSEEFCKVGFYNEWHIHNDSLMNDEINRRRKEIGLREYNEKIKKFERGKQICREIRLKKIYKHIRLFYWCG